MNFWKGPTNSQGENVDKFCFVFIRDKANSGHYTEPRNILKLSTYRHFCCQPVEYTVAWFSDNQPVDIII